MATVYHIYPSDMYRAAALQAYISRGFSYKEAVESAIEAANLMVQEIDKNADYEFV